MATTGVKYATSGSSVSETPWDDVLWGSPTDATGAPDASSSGSSHGTNNSFVLKLSGYDFSSIPDGSTIDGVVVSVVAAELTANATISLVQLLDTSGSRVGDNKASTPQALTTTDATYTFGGASDEWGNALTAAWVKDADFGVGIACTGDASSISLVNAVGIEVHYTAPPPRIYWIIDDSSGWSDPTGAQIVAGNNAADAAAVASGDVESPTTTTADVVLANPATGLTASTAYKAAAVWFDGVDYSDVVVSAEFTTTAGDLALTGQSLTAATGTLAPSITVALTGQSATAATGTITPTQAATAALTGESATAATGTLTPSITVALTGESVTAATGTLAPAITVALTGESATAATGTITATQDAVEALTGQSVTAATGTLATSITVALTGESVTAATGTVGATTGAVVALTGEAVTAATGSVGLQVDATRALTGEGLTAATGTVAPSVGATVALTGQGATAALGSVSPAISVNLSGIALATTAGVVSPAGDAEVALTGQNITISAGTITAATPDVTLALSGLSMTTARGSIYLQGVWSPVDDESSNTWIPVVDTAANTWTSVVDTAANTWATI